MIDFGKITGFEWDEGNRDKNWDNHKVAWWEIEETFFHQPFVVAPDPSHSDQETRFYALGHTKGGRLLQIVFTIRGTKIRPISARNMSRKSGRSMAKQRKKVPIFKSEDEEREFWARHDSTDYIDHKKAKRVQFPNLKPSSRAISIRLPESLIENIKVLANREDVPYQSMMKVLLAEKVTEALRSPKRKKTAA